MEPQPHRSGTSVKFGYYRMMAAPDGEQERELKRRLVAHFQNDMGVLAMYLTAIEYVNTPDQHALALSFKLAFGAKESQVIAQAGDVYAALYPRGETLHMFCQSDKNEYEIRRLFDPFYQNPRRADMLGKKTRLHLSMTAHVSASCVSGKPLLEAVREEPILPNESGWRFYTDSSQWEDSANAETWTLYQVLNRSPEFAEWLDAPAGTALWRLSPKNKWQPLAGKAGHGEPPRAKEPFKRYGNLIPDIQGVSVPADEEGRTALALRPGVAPPMGIHVYYECLGCGEVVSSAAREAKCRCGNIAVAGGQVAVKDLAKAHAFKQK